MEETGFVLAVLLGSASVLAVIFFASQHGPEVLFFES